MSERLQARVRQIRARSLIRRWELRQRGHAKGTWYRLRRLLAGAERVFVVSDDDFSALIAAGHPAHPVGRELEPERRITSAALPEIQRVPSAREVPVRLSSSLLLERNWVLVPFAPRTTE